MPGLRADRMSVPCPYCQRPVERAPDGDNEYCDSCALPFERPGANILRDKLIATFGLTERTDAYTDRPHADLWSGSGVAPNVAYADDGSNRVRRLLPPDADWPEAWSDWPYRIVWRVPSERMHVTFCEGDVSVLAARSAEDFAAIDASADNFYGQREDER